MFKIDVDTKAIEKALGDLDDAVRGRAATDGMRNGAELAARIWQGYAAVDTGRYKRSIKVAEVSARHAKIHSDPGDFPEAYYPIFVEFGTYKMAPQPAARPTVDVHGDEIAQAVIDAISKAAGL